MKVKTKTAAIILQKQIQRQKINTEPYISSNPQIVSNKTISKQQQKSRHKNLTVRHLACYDVYSETIKCEKQQKMQKNWSNHSNLPQQYCQLQKQNYRLIQANYNILNKFSSVLDIIRKQLMRVIQSIEQYQYVLATKTVYGLLDLIRKIGDNNYNIAKQSAGFREQDKIKRDIPLNMQHNKQKWKDSPQIIYKHHIENIAIKEFDSRVQINSDVEEYQYKEFKPPKKIINNTNRKFTICVGLSTINYVPEKSVLSINNILLENQCYLQREREISREKQRQWQRERQRQRQRQRQIQMQMQMERQRQRQRQNDNYKMHSHSVQVRMLRSSVIPLNQKQKYQSSFEHLGINSKIQQPNDYKLGRKLKTQSYYGAQQTNEEPHQDYNQNRNRPYSQKNIKIINDNISKKKRMETAIKADQFYRFLLIQATTIQNLLQ